MISYYSWFFLFFCIGYLIVTDQSVARFFDLLLKIVKFQYEKTKWWLIHNPRNPIVKYLMWRRALKLAKELEKELKK